MQLDAEKIHLTRQWMMKAERDLLTAERALIGSPPLRDIAVYHCQQAAEKALKAFLTWHDRPFRKTHELGNLVRECTVVDPDFSQLLDAADVLNPYVAEFRYPSDVEEPTAGETDDARQHARDVLDFVKARLPRQTWP